jgi:thiaminase/transcriptional activator TenA
MDPADHPFVRAAAEGTLPREAFDRWLVEDHHFVVGFRRFLARLVELAPDEAARDLLAGAQVPLQAELDLFRAEAEKRGLDLTAEPGPTTLGYTSFLLAAPADGWPVALTVLYGAEKAYFDAWSVVRTQAEASSPYWSFIDNWSSPAFGAWVDDLARLVATLAPSPELDRAFDRVVRVELRFWDAVHRGEGWS